MADGVSDANARAWIEREARNCGHPATCLNCAIQAVAAAVKAKGEEISIALDAAGAAKHLVDGVFDHAADVPAPPQAHP